MILQDQPTCFPENITVRVSSKSDGSVLNRENGFHATEYIARRQDFCRSCGVDYTNAVYQRIVYQKDSSYNLIVAVDQQCTTAHTPDVAADALYTTTKNVTLFLPVADCVATVFYDPIRQALAIAHLGRHSTYAKLAARMVEYFVDNGSNPADVIVWMGPHAQKQSYVLDWFDKRDDPDWKGYYTETAEGIYLDMAGFNRRLMERQGVSPTNIHVSLVDTMVDDNYFSHKAGDVTGRIAVVAVMR